MNYIFWILSGLFSFWIEVLFSRTLQIAGFKLDLVFITLIILTLRWQNPFLLFYGLLLGMMSDAFSHSMIGLYGISYFLSLIIVRWVGDSFYENNVFSTVFFVFLLSIVEGGLAAFFLKILSQLSWNTLFFQTELPVAVIQSLISPLLFLILRKTEAVMHLNSDKTYDN
ncbi:rod shape-determining protein MreD [Deltaproteobacteria bacterium TL4]